MGNYHCGGLRGCQCHLHMQPAGFRRSSQFLADGTWNAKQPPEAADVDRYQIVAMALEPRRKILCQFDEPGPARQSIGRWRTIDTRVPGIRDPGSGIRDPGSE